MRLSLVALLAANAVPLLGVLFLGWWVGSILAIYWAESAVIGAFTLLELWALPWRPDQDRLPSRLLLTVFFPLHFGSFLFVHSVFAAAIASAAGPPVEIHSPLDAPGYLLAALEGGAALALAGLVLSHGVSFVTDFVFGAERLRLDAGAVMRRPYARIVVMHVTVLLGAAGVQLLGTPQLAVVLLVALKSAVDARAHVREHAAATAA